MFKYHFKMLNDYINKTILDPKDFKTFKKLWYLRLANTLQKDKSNLSYFNNLYKEEVNKELEYLISLRNNIPESLKRLSDSKLQRKYNSLRINNLWTNIELALVMSEIQLRYSKKKKEQQSFWFSI